jgi:RsiW-degrading membrane proteinase PrsW (M82 family)
MDILFGLWLSVMAAVVPVAIYALLMWWADRYEREPFLLLLAAFAWGAVPAILIVVFAPLLGGGAETDGGSDIFYYCVEAPFTEEFVKGLAVLGLFLFHRKQFDGVLDGLIYGALVGFGFSMTEDFLYYVSALDEGGLPSLAGTIFLRGVFFALNHSVYTGLTGMGFGLAAVSRGGFRRLLWPVLGFLSAVFAHSVHNFGAWLMEAFGDSDRVALAGLGLLLSLLFAVLGVLLLVTVIFSAWFLQRRIIREELSLLVGELLTAEELVEISSRWTQPVSCRKPATQRRKKLVQLALKQRRLKIAGSADEPDLVAETGRLHHELRLAYSSVDATS